MSIRGRFSVNGAGEGEDNSLAERHRRADEALAQKYNQLAQKWADAESYFRSLHLPQPIYASYNESEPDPSVYPCPHVWDCLSFRRYKGKWRLCYARCYSHQAEEGTEPDWKPVVECSTEVRLEAAGQLGKLKMEAAMSKEEYVAKVDKALRDIDDLLSD